MTTSELISYIKKQIANHISKDVIIAKLLDAGWYMNDINEGFLKVESELHPIDIPKPEVKVEQPQREAPRVWVPHNLPILEKSQTMVVEEQELELPAKKEEKKEEKREELIPTLMPKVTINSFGSVNRENFGKKEEPIVPIEPTKNYSIKDLPKVAMLSSYKQDLLSVNQIKEESPKKVNSKMIKWLVIALIVIGVLGGAVWAFEKGYINIKDFNFSLIKKDPKVLILNNSKVLSSLTSYKTETNIEISFPSVVDISAGLISGEAVPQTDNDSISVNTLGIIDQSDGNFLSDNFITVKSSLLQNYITTGVKSNGSDLFISVPDLSQIIGEDAPKSSIVKIDEQQFNLIPPLFSQDVELQLKKLNLYKILSTGVPSYINDKTLSSYDELIKNVEIIEKGQEKIKDIDTYHYSINTDKDSARNLLIEIADNFTSNLSEEDKNKLTQIFGSVMINSFDVWIGKGDNNVYQYHIILEVPLSKILGFDDESIGDNKVALDWQTTYYDFNIPNNIFMPEDSIPIVDFVNTVNKNKLKNDVLSFSGFARSLFNAEGSYGKKANTKGSCMSPVSGSLFSPTGHPKGAVSSVSSLSELLNQILSITEGVGTCYSTTKAWSFTIPISDNYDITSIPTPTYESFFCVDSTGATKDLVTPPTGVICE
ncbi:MAG: hypothetical protein WC603_01665 [Candidatus Paceibacterota bacterium]|jgi:hypothetical protein